MPWALSKRALEFLLLGGDAGAILVALRQVAFVKLADALHFGVAEVKLIAQPGEVIAAGSKLADANPPGEQVGGAGDGRAGQDYCEEDEQGAAHGSLPQRGRADGIQVTRFGEVFAAAGALGNPQRKAEHQHDRGGGERPAWAQEPRREMIEPVRGGPSGRGSFRPLDPTPHGVLEAGGQVGCRAGLAQQRAQFRLIRHWAIGNHGSQGGVSATQ